MEFFQLHHPPNVTVLCDRKGCEQVADYLEVDDHGQEYRVCASHTDSKTHASRLPTRKPCPDLPFRSLSPDFSQLLKKTVGSLVCGPLQSWICPFLSQ
jgi:hypothetical protein